MNDVPIQVHEQPGDFTSAEQQLEYVPPSSHAVHTFAYAVCKITQADSQSVECSPTALLQGFAQFFAHVVTAQARAMNRPGGHHAK